MKKSTFFVIFLLFFNSCSILWKNTPSFVKENFTFLYDEEYMGIDTLIDIKGFYILPRLTVTNNSMDTSYGSSVCIFFRDGVFFTTIGIVGDYYEKKFEQKIKEYIYEDIQPFHNNDFWGSYFIYDNIIKTQCVEKAISLNYGWSIYERWYKIIDKETIMLVYTKPLGKGESAIDYYNKHRKNDIILPSRFIPLDTIPSSDAWIKKEKWFWKDEAGWKAYMERQKK